jgi:hypothetical protein
MGTHSFKPMRTARWCLRSHTPDGVQSLLFPFAADPVDDYVTCYRDHPRMGDARNDAATNQQF